jgi:hypothetical protein
LTIDVTDVRINVQCSIITDLPLRRHWWHFFKFWSAWGSEVHLLSRASLGTSLNVPGTMNYGVGNTDKFKSLPITGGFASFDPMLMGF